MQATGNKPPGILREKAVYMSNDLKRAAKYFQVPLCEPPDLAEVMFKKGSLKAQQLLTAASIHTPHALEDISRALWERIWSRNEDIVTTESLHLACQAANARHATSSSAHGFMSSPSSAPPPPPPPLPQQQQQQQRQQGGDEGDVCEMPLLLTSDDIEMLLVASTAHETKATLKACTGEAIALGAFGAPWIAVYPHHVEKEEEQEPCKMIIVDDESQKDSSSSSSSSKDSSPSSSAPPPPSCFFGSDRMEMVARELGRSFMGPVPNPLREDIQSILDGRAKL